MKARRATTQGKERFAELARRALIAQIEQRKIDFANLAARYRGTFRGPRNLSSRKGYGNRRATIFVACITVSGSLIAQSSFTFDPLVADQIRHLKEDQEKLRHEMSGESAQPPTPPPEIGNAVGGKKREAYERAVRDYTAAMDRFKTQQPYRWQQEEERELRTIREAPLPAQVNAYTERLESLLGMAPRQTGEDPEARRAEASDRILRLTDDEQKIRVQTVLNALEPAAAQLRRSQQNNQMPNASASEPSAIPDQNSAEFKAAVQRSKEIAMARYPQCVDPSSDLSKKMVEIADRLEAQGSNLVYRADAPERIADMAANELRIAPKQ
jgi:hypothetical protein